MTTPIRRLIDRLARRGYEPHQISPNTYESRCPGHKGTRRNLSIAEGSDGTVLLRCHHIDDSGSNCSVASIVAELGIGLKDLFVTASAPRRPKGKGSPKSMQPLEDAGKPKRKPAGFESPREAAEFLSRKLGSGPSGHWVYRLEDGAAVAAIYRFDLPGGKTCRPVSLDPETGLWVIKDPPKGWVLYRLAESVEARRVFFLEGEKCAELARGLGLVATTTAHGAESPHRTDLTPLAGKEIVILPDVGAAGEGYVTNLFGLLAKLEPLPRVRVVRLPGLREDGDDIEQWLASLPESWDADRRREDLERLADEAQVEDLETATGREDPGAETKEGKPAPEPQAQILLRLAQGAQLFHGADGKTYATIGVGDHAETYLIRSTSMRRWLTREFFREREGPPSTEAMQGALGVLEAKAEFDGALEPVWIRVGEGPRSEDPDDSTYLVDLVNPQWQAVEITRRGWRVVDETPVKFRRAKGMLSLPTPEPGGSIEDLRIFLNVGSEDDWRLIVAFLTAALRPTGPYPILAINGEQGSAKTTSTRVIRRLLDPNPAPLRDPPREARDVMISANNAWVMTYDNISGLSGWLSDALCRLATGGGFATRTLYADDEETLFDAMRPVMLNGIEDVATQADLLDRCIVLTLPTIPDGKRREEGPFWLEFEAALPKHFGALLDAVAGGLREFASVQLDRLPRMADFARWGEAVGRALGWPEGAFLDAYDTNRKLADTQAVEDSPVAMAVCSLVRESASWEGTATELLEELGPLAGERATKAKDWPQTPRKLSGVLKRVAPSLRKSGIEVTFAREGGGKRRLIRIDLESRDDISSPSSHPSQRGDGCDGNCLGDKDLGEIEACDGCCDGRDDSVTIKARNVSNRHSQPSQPGECRITLPINGLGDQSGIHCDGRGGRDGQRPLFSGEAPSGREVGEL